MAVQQWTILKLVGPAAMDAASRFDRWWNARRSADPSCFTTEAWRAPVRRAVAGYLSRLAEHRYEPPVVYFSQHVDLWLAGGMVDRHLVDVSAHVLHDAGELWCYRLPDRGRLVRRNQSIVRNAQFPESEWLARRMIEAAHAYQTLSRDAVLLVNREVITASATHEEAKRQASTMPGWLGRTAMR